MIVGGVEFANILAGDNTSLSAVNGDAQIGTVKVGGDWAREQPDRRGEERQVFGSPDSFSNTDHFGFVAAQIGSLTIDGNAIGVPANSTPLAIGGTSDVSIHIIP